MAGKIVSFINKFNPFAPASGGAGGEPPVTAMDTAIRSYVRNDGTLIPQLKSVGTDEGQHNPDNYIVEEVKDTAALHSNNRPQPPIDDKLVVDGVQYVIRGDHAYQIDELNERVLSNKEVDQLIAAAKAQISARMERWSAETQRLHVQEDVEEEEIGEATVLLPPRDESDNVQPLFAADAHRIQQQLAPEIDPEINTIRESAANLKNVIFSRRFIDLRILDGDDIAAETLPPHHATAGETLPPIFDNFIEDTAPFDQEQFAAEFNLFAARDSLDLAKATKEEAQRAHSELTAPTPQAPNKRDLLIEDARQMMRSEPALGKPADYNLGRAMLLLSTLSMNDAYYASRQIDDLTTIVAGQIHSATSQLVRKHSAILLDKIHEYESFLLTQEAALAARDRANKERQEKMCAATRRSMERIAVLMQRSEQPVPSADTPAFDPQHITSTNEAIAALKFQSREVWLWGLIKLSEVVLKEREYNDKFTALDPDLAHKKAGELAVSNPDLKDLLLRFTEFDPAQDEKSQLFHVQLARNLVTAINPRHKFGKTPVALVKRKPIVRKEPKQGLLAGFKRYVIALFTPAPKKLDWQLRIEQYQKLADEDKNWIRFSQNNAVSLEAGYSSWAEVQAKAKAARAKAIEDRRREAERKLALG